MKYVGQVVHVDCSSIDAFDYENGMVVVECVDKQQCVVSGMKRNSLDVEQRAMYIAESALYPRNYSDFLVEERSALSEISHFVRHCTRGPSLSFIDFGEKDVVPLNLPDVIRYDHVEEDLIKISTIDSVCIGYSRGVVNHKRNCKSSSTSCGCLRTSSRKSLVSKGHTFELKCFDYVLDVQFMYKITSHAMGVEMLGYAAQFFEIVPSEDVSYFVDQRTAFDVSRKQAISSIRGMSVESYALLFNFRNQLCTYAETVRLIRNKSLIYLDLSLEEKGIEFAREAHGRVANFTVSETQSQMIDGFRSNFESGSKFFCSDDVLSVQTSTSFYAMPARASVKTSYLISLHFSYISRLFMPSVEAAPCLDAESEGDIDDLVSQFDTDVELSTVKKKKKPKKKKAKDTGVTATSDDPETSRSPHVSETGNALMVQRRCMEVLESTLEFYMTTQRERLVNEVGESDARHLFAMKSIQNMVYVLTGTSPPTLNEFVLIVSDSEMFEISDYKIRLSESKTASRFSLRAEERVI